MIERVMSYPLFSYGRCFNMANEKTERAARNAENEYRAERKKRLAKAAKQKSKKKHDSTDVIATVIKVLACLALVGLIIFGLYEFGVPQRLLPALKVGSRTYSVAEYDYYYSNVYQTYAQQASTMQESYGFNLTGFDYTKSPADQMSGEETFDQVFQKRVVSSLEEQQYYIGLAKENEMTLSEENVKAINDLIAEFETNAKTQNNMSPDNYIGEIYGKGMNRKLLRKVLEEQYLADQYKAKMESDTAGEITDAAIEEAFSKDSKLYTAVDIRLFGLPIGEDADATTPASTEPASEQENTSEEANSEEASSEEVSSEEAASEEAPSEENVSEEPASEEPASEEPSSEDAASSEPASTEGMSRQEILANEMLARVTDEDSFIALAEEYAAEKDKETFKDPDNTLQVGVKYNTIKTNFDEELANWLFDSARKVGDKRVCKNDNYVFVIMIKNTAYREESPLVSARHILVSFESIASEIKQSDAEANTENTEVEEFTAEDGEKISNEGTTYSAEVILKAYEKAKSIYDEYKAGAQTEDAFAALAEEYSNDTGSVGENTSGGGLYTDVPKGQMVKPFENWIYDSSRQVGDTGIVKTNYGYHIMYFVGRQEEPEWKVTVREALAKEIQETAEESAKANYEGTAKDSLCISWAKKSGLAAVEKLVSRYSTAS